MRMLFVAIVLYPFASFASGTAIQSIYSALDDIKDRYAVPGMSVVIASGGVRKPLTLPVQYYKGVLKEGGDASVKRETYFPIASLTKPIASHMVMNLANEQKLSLDDSVSKWIPEVKLPAYITINDLLSHTLIGGDSRTFFYDSRFSLLTQVIEACSERAFQELLSETIIKQFNNTRMLLYQEESITQLITSNSVATGHRYQGQSIPIPHDYGVSASAGLVATTDAMIKTGVHLLQSFAAKKNKQHVFDSTSPGQIYANGFFRYDAGGVQVYWGYGQYDGFASLWIIVPDSEHQLIMMANNNVLSDSARLIFGDPTTSPVFNLFSRYFLCEESRCDHSFDNQRADLHRNVYFSRYKEGAYHSAVEGITSLYPDEKAWKESGDLNLLFMSSYLFAVSKNLEYDLPRLSDKELLLVSEARNRSLTNIPYWLFYAGLAYDKEGDIHEARKIYQELINMPNMPSHWTVNEAKNWLAQNPASL